MQQSRASNSRASSGPCISLCSSVRSLMSGCINEETLVQLDLGRYLPLTLREHWQQASTDLKSKKGCGTSPYHKQWLNVDACGVLCATMVWTIMIYSQFVVSFYVISPWLGIFTSFWGLFHFLVFNAIAILCLLCHARTMLSNPGAVPPNAKPLTPEGWASQCHKCHSFKPPRAHHCSICGRCVIKMDHHCPWVNNCVGIANHKFFLLFLIYCCSSCVYGLVLMACRGYYCLYTPPGAATSSSCEVTAGTTLAVLTVMCFAALFALFTCCMACDQSSVVTTNQTQIDRMKSHHSGGGSGGGGGGGGGHGHTHGGSSGGGHNHSHGGNSGSLMRPTGWDRRKVWDNISEIVGGDAYQEGFRIAWLLPVPIVYRNPEALSGYCYRDTPRPKTLAELEQV